jgi:hypothetical protein
VQDITHARTGDIVAIAGLKDVTTGDTLCDEKAPIVLERMEFPDPVIKVWRPRLPSVVLCEMYPLVCGVPVSGRLAGVERQVVYPRRPANSLDKAPDMDVAGGY